MGVEYLALEIDKFHEETEIMDALVELTAGGPSSQSPTTFSAQLKP